jgi:hypothetical protein
MAQTTGRTQGIHLMNASIHRVGLAVATLAVVVTVGGYFVADGYLSARRSGSAGPAAAGSLVPPSPTATAAGTAPPEVVYVRPAPSPKVIHVTQTAPPAPPHVVHVTVPGTGGENNGTGGENDGGGD